MQDGVRTRYKVVLIVQDFINVCKWTSGGLCRCVSVNFEEVGSEDEDNNVDAKGKGMRRQEHMQTRRGSRLMRSLELCPWSTR